MAKEYITRPGCQVIGLARMLEEYIGYKEDGFFVEIGAFNCQNWSSTIGLVQMGWSGIYVEPNPDMANECRELYQGHPRIRVEQVAIGARNDTTKLYIGGSNSTIVEEMVDLYNANEWAKYSGLDKDKFTIVDMHTMDMLLYNMDVEPGFDLLVIDVEGAEVDVLSGFDIKHWSPTMVIIEVHEHEKDEALRWAAGPVNAFFDLRGYIKIYSDHINNVFVDSRTKERSWE